MSDVFTPNEMTWHFDGYELRLDEDGLHIFLGSARRAFEQPEVLHLIQRYNAILRTVQAAGPDDALFAAPAPPSPERIREMGSMSAERRVIQDQIRNLKRQLDDAPSF